jgi:hypothetical protein
MSCSAYTLSRGDGTFIHQHVVDTYAAQNATAELLRGNGT